MRETISVKWSCPGKYPLSFAEFMSVHKGGKYAGVSEYMLYGGIPLAALHYKTGFRCIRPVGGYSRSFFRYYLVYSSSSWIADCTFVKVHAHAGGMLYPFMDILSLEKSFRRFWNCYKIIDNESLPFPYERIRRILHGD